jgi:hypothetical protein
VGTDLINISTNQVLEVCPENRNLQQICSEQFIIYIMEERNDNDFLMLCMEKNEHKFRKAKFPYYQHGYYNDMRLVLSESQKQLFIHIISNEVSVLLL